jgi:hypothetical protein
VEHDECVEMVLADLERENALERRLGAAIREIMAVIREMGAEGRSNFSPGEWLSGSTTLSMRCRSEHPNGWLTRSVAA